jgi:hypothetical protein
MESSKRAALADPDVRRGGGQMVDRVCLVGQWPSPLTHHLLDFLTRNQVPFHWVDVDRDPLAAFLLDGRSSTRRHCLSSSSWTGRASRFLATSTVRIPSS